MNGGGVPGDTQGSRTDAEKAYWASLYEKYHNEVRARFARRVRCPHDVDDLMQNVFLNIMVRGGDFEQPRTYLFAVARHQLLAYWRQQKRGLQIAASRAEADPDTPAGLDHDSDPLKQLSSKETQAQVKTMIGSLTPALRDALRLRYIDGLHLNAAAARAHCSRFALRKRLVRAKRSLMELWQAGRTKKRTQGHPNNTTVRPAVRS